MRNICDFKNVAKIGRLLVGNGLESNEVDFEGHAGPDQEPMETTNHLCDAGVHVDFGYRMYSVPGGTNVLVGQHTVNIYH